MQKLAGWTLIGMGVLHAIVLGVEALPYIGHWTRGGLWSTEHLEPFGEQSKELLTSNAVFWATLGSAAGPLAILGALILRLARQGVTLPSFVGWSLMMWALVASVVMQPSGFPFAILIGVALVVKGRSKPTGRAYIPKAGMGVEWNRWGEDPLSHPDLVQMNPLQLADLPFERTCPDPATGGTLNDRAPPSAGINS